MGKSNACFSESGIFQLFLLNLLGALIFKYPPVIGVLISYQIWEIIFSQAFFKVCKLNHTRTCAHTAYTHLQARSSELAYTHLSRNYTVQMPADAQAHYRKLNTQLPISNRHTIQRNTTPLCSLCTDWYPKLSQPFGREAIAMASAIFRWVRGNCARPRQQWRVSTLDGDSFVYCVSWLHRLCFKHIMGIWMLHSNWFTHSLESFCMPIARYRCYIEWKDLDC